MQEPLIQLGNFVLSSGFQSDWKLECDRFVEENAEGLAFLIRRLIGPFSSVEGVPRGGLRLAEALGPFVEATGPALLVDDVYTTGGSMNRYRGDRDIKGAVIFARGPCPPWIRPVFQLPERLWLSGRDRSGSEHPG